MARRGLDLVVTARCNQRCAYCFENDTKNRSMSWAVARASLDALLAAPARCVRIGFFGGEPLLAFETIRKVIELATLRPRGPRCRFWLSTNGTLLDRDKAAFLAAHDVRMQISFDGVPEAQVHRGRGTFEVLDALLDRLRTYHPAYFARSVSVAMTVSPATIETMARSVRYFLDKRVRDIVIGARTTFDATWCDARLPELDRAFSDVARLARDEYRRTGHRSVGLFRKRRAQRRRRPGAITMCAAARGHALAVDIDGSIVACGVLARSIQRFAATGPGEQLATLTLGHVLESGAAWWADGASDRLRDIGIFGDKREKFSSYGRCADCKYVRSCAVCPASIAQLPGNDDPRRVPDFLCAFNRIWLTHRDRFPVTRPSSPAGRRRRVARWLRTLDRFAEPALSVPAPRR